MNSIHTSRNHYKSIRSNKAHFLWDEPADAPSVPGGRWDPDEKETGGTELGNETNRDEDGLFDVGDEPIGQNLVGICNSRETDFLVWSHLEFTPDDDHVPCPIPHKKDSGEHAKLFKTHGGNRLLRCFHAKVTVTPVEVYALRAYKGTDCVEKFVGDFLKRKKRKASGGPQMAQWTVRLLAEACVVELPDVGAREAGDDLTEGEAKVYDGFVTLLRCKMAYSGKKETATTWACRFAAAWCGIATYVDAWRYTKNLVRKGYLEEAGVEPKSKSYMYRLA